MVQRLRQGTHGAQTNMGLCVPSSLPRLFWTQVDLTNEVNQHRPFLQMLRSDADTSTSQQPWRTARCPGHLFFETQKLHGSSACLGLPAEPAAKEILSVCKGSWAAAADAKDKAKTFSVEGFIGQHDFYRCCVNFKHLPFSARVLLLCVKLPLGMIYFLGRRHGLHVQ